MTSASSVREDFSCDARFLTRRLSVNGTMGYSSVELRGNIPLSPTQETLASMWDGLTLRHPVTWHDLEGGEPLKIGDVFCGAGGLSYGVHQAAKACGLNTKSVLAMDVDSVALDVYRRNFDPEQFANKDLWQSVTHSYSTRRKPASFLDEPRTLIEELQAAKGQVDILLGGPPCGGHSTSNNVTRRNDSRNRYYIVMPALAVALDAKAVIVENVPGVIHDSKHVLQNAKELFETSGYKVSDSIVDAGTLGLPQTRKRHILVASKESAPDLETIASAFKRPSRDLRWGIGDLMDILPGDLFDTGAELSDVNRRRIKYLFDHDEYDLPNEHRPDSHKNGHTYPAIYGRLKWDRPSGTITTGYNTPGRGRYIHPEAQRTITPHEAARIQGFSDCFEFRITSGEVPSRSSLANIIGAAVPPQIGFAAGVAALAALDLHSFVNLASRNP